MNQHDSGQAEQEIGLLMHKKSRIKDQITLMKTNTPTHPPQKKKKFCEFQESPDRGRSQEWCSEACQGAFICQAHTFQSSRNLLTENFLLLPTSGGRLRQHQAQPMWDASSQSQTILPWSWSSKICCRVEKHLRLAWLAEGASIAPGRRGGREGTVSKLVSLQREDNRALSVGVVFSGGQLAVWNRRN